MCAWVHAWVSGRHMGRSMHAREQLIARERQPRDRRVELLRVGAPRAPAAPSAGAAAAAAAPAGAARVRVACELRVRRALGRRRHRPRRLSAVAGQVVHIGRRQRRAVGVDGHERGGRPAADARRDGAGAPGPRAGRGARRGRALTSVVVVSRLSHRRAGAVGGAVGRVGGGGAGHRRRARARVLGRRAFAPVVQQRRPRRGGRRGRRRALRGGRAGARLSVRERQLLGRSSLPPEPTRSRAHEAPL